VRSKLPAIYTLSETCKLNAVDPRACLADVLARIADHPAKRITDLLPWYWRTVTAAAQVA
jgi:transposase